MKRTWITLTAVILFIFAGCDSADVKKGQVAVEEEKSVDNKQFLTANFQQDQKLRYRFSSSREIETDWEPSITQSKSGKSRKDNSHESMQMVLSYEPVEIDPYGLTTVKVTCESVKVTRRGKGQKSRKDAVETLPGKTFTLTVSATGRIADYSQLKQLILETGKNAFRPKSRRGRVKEPDMISDFIATQWFLWDSISSIKNPADGVAVGQSWNSTLSAPGPMVKRIARDVTYTLSEVKQNQLAVITSAYGPAKLNTKTWPIPYTGSFQASGRFGFLRNYQLLELQGTGQELFNIEAGRTERYTQRYKMKLETSTPLGMGIKPIITIEQTISMEIL